MKLDWRTEWPMWVLIVAMFALAAYAWGGAPDRMPVHWGLSGQPDRWGGKFEALMLAPLIGLALYLVMTFMPRVDPGRANYPLFIRAYHSVRLLMLLFMTAMQVGLVLVARGVAVDMATYVPLGTGALFVVLGNLLGKLRPNWFIGIRTPWTLSSKLAWTRTHRAGGWMFIVLGLLLMGSSLARDPRVMTAMLVVMGAGIAGLAVYSYLVWRSDPDKTPPAGSTPAA